MNNSNIDISSLKIEEIESVAKNYGSSIIEGLLSDNQKALVSNAKYRSARSTFLNSTNIPSLYISFTNNPCFFKIRDDKEGSITYSIISESLNEKEKLFFNYLDEYLNKAVQENIKSINTKLGNKAINSILPFISGSAKPDAENQDIKYLKLAITSNYKDNAFVEGYKTEFYRNINNKSKNSEKLTPKTPNDLQEILVQGITGKCRIRITKILNNDYTLLGKAFRLSFNMLLLFITNVDGFNNSKMLESLGIIYNEEKVKEEEVEEVKKVKKVEKETLKTNIFDALESNNEYESEDESEDEEEIITIKQSSNNKLSKK